MDQGPSARPVAEPRPARPGAPPGNGLAPYVTDVQRARARLGRSLDELNDEVRAQIGQSMEKATFKVAVGAATVAAALAARKALALVWKKARNDGPPPNPGSPGTAWGEALTWTLATAVGAGIAKLLAERGATAGWRKAVGSLPPGV